ncbi:MAG: hypothetical protein AB7Q42_05910 [Acidimicrobiia bacterium]
MHGHISALLAVSLIGPEVRDRMESNPRKTRWFRRSNRDDRWLTLGSALRMTAPLETPRI